MRPLLRYLMPPIKPDARRLCGLAKLWLIWLRAGSSEKPLRYKGL